MEVTDTATIIARVRAAESELPPGARLFVDPFAHLFASDAEPDVLDEQLTSLPFFREQVRARTRFIDDFVLEGVSGGARQIVILGAGFDCRALRLRAIAETGSRVYEVDFPSQLETKRRALAAGGVAIPDHLRLVGCDFNAAGFESSLTAGLVAAGFSGGALTLFLWEGVITYLEPGEIERMLCWMARAGARGSRVVFNYTVNLLAGNTVESMSARGEAAGFSSVDDRSVGAVYRHYVRAEPPSEVADLFRLAVAVR
ncbi:MAG: SAM-dependent methyltransferase [Candidatus Binatia bacterium]